MKCSICKKEGHTKRTCQLSSLPDIDEKEEPHQTEEKKNSPSSELMEETVHMMFIRIIQQQKEKEERQDIWKDSPYKDLVRLQSNNVGVVGEEIINQICRASSIDACCNGLKTKRIGGGDGDGTILGKSVEIKTAHQGSSHQTFQHELGEVPWQGSEYIIFIDISPICIYLTIFRNMTENMYKSKEKLLVFPTKSITWRKEKGAFKLDTSVKINEDAITRGHTLKITPNTKNNIIGEFIRRKINES